MDFLIYIENDHFIGFDSVTRSHMGPRLSTWYITVFRGYYSATMSAGTCCLLDEGCSSGGVRSIPVIAWGYGSFNLTVGWMWAAGKRGLSVFILNSFHCGLDIPGLVLTHNHPCIDMGVCAAGGEGCSVSYETVSQASPVGQQGSLSSHPCALTWESSPMYLGYIKRIDLTLSFILTLKTCEYPVWRWVSCYKTCNETVLANYQGERFQCGDMTPQLLPLNSHRRSEQEEFDPFLWCLLPNGTQCGRAWLLWDYKVCKWICYINQILVNSSVLYLYPSIAVSLSVCLSGRKIKN